VANASPAASEAVSMLETAFYCIADRRHFLGAVALLNSLRVVGHDEPFFLLDAGLTADQRAFIADHAVVIAAPQNVHPVFLKPHGPTQYPAGVAIVFDADIIVTRPLTGLIEKARSGQLVAFVDNPPHHDRFFPEWQAALDLGPLRRQPYFAAGQLFIPRQMAQDLLPAWEAAQEMIDVDRTWFGRGKLFEPFYFADMDAINAIASASLRPDEITFLDHRLAPTPPFAGLSLVDKRSLSCRYADGTQPFLLHHFLAKPWIRATRTTIYSSLLTRLLLGGDVVARVDKGWVPLRLRKGHLADLDRRRAHLQATIRSNARRQLGRFGIRTRLAAWRSRHATGR
jgi:hypothetical protein